MADPDPDTIAAGVIAAKKYASGITFMEINVGDKITDQEYHDLVSAVIKAVDDYRGGTSI